MNHKEVAELVAADPTQKDFLEKQYVLKEPFIHGGKGIYFPGERSLQPDGKAYIKKPRYSDSVYILQKYHQLPRKLAIDEAGMVGRSVDIRAYMTIPPMSSSVDMQIFAREGGIDTVANVSSG